MASRIRGGAINLLLVGRTGQGKSATSCSIIGERECVSRLRLDAVVRIPVPEAVVPVKNVVVVESQGITIGDIHPQRDFDRLTIEIRKALTKQSDGFDAILIVIRYGRRFTTEDKLAFQMLEELFGTDHIKRHGIMVVTHADYYHEKDNNDMAIETFLQEQVGLFQSMREKCSNRLVAFDNRTRSQSVRQSQVKRLLDMVIEMKKEGRRYTLTSLPRDSKKNMDSILQAEMLGRPYERKKSLTRFLEIYERKPLEKLSVEELRATRARCKEHREELTETCAGQGYSTLTPLISQTSRLEDNIIARLETIQKTGRGNGDDITYRVGEDLIKILLVGKTGYGKSSTGNNILGEEMFMTSAGFSSVTKLNQREVATVQGHNVVVVDSPGLADTDIETDGGLRQLANEIINIFATQPDGFDVILITIPYGSRITAEDKRVFQELDLLLGKEFVNHCGILVVTHADNHDPEKNGTIEEFMEKQTGEFQHLRQNRVNNRVVYFDNKTKDDSVRQAQVKQLLDMAVDVKKDPQTFIPEVCVRAQKTRDEALKKAGKPVIRSETIDKLTLIIRKLFAFSLESKDIKQLKSVITKLQEVQTKLKEEVQDKKMQDNLIFTVCNLEKAVGMKISAIEKSGDVKSAEKNIRQEISALAKLLQAYDELKYSLIRHDLGPVLATFIYPVLAISSFFKKIVPNVSSFIAWLRR